jgi:dihydroorotate dehydrogenase electron transfer subunit
MRGLFVVRAERPRTLLLGEEAGVACVVSEAERLRTDPSTPPGERWRPLVLMGSDTPFPFRTRPSSIILPGIPPGVIACHPFLEAGGIPNRLATRSDFPGCFDGRVIDLAAGWLGSLGPAELDAVEVFVCGPASLLEAAAELARRYGAPCQPCVAPPQAV